MRVFIIDTSNMAPELRGGLVGVEGSWEPTAAEKHECVEAVSTYVMDGWAIAADPGSPIGWLAALTAETACVPFVNLTRLAPGEHCGPQPSDSSTVDSVPMPGLWHADRSDCAAARCRRD